MNYQKQLKWRKRRHFQLPAGGVVGRYAPPLEQRIPPTNGRMGLRYRFGLCSYRMLGSFVQVAAPPLGAAATDHAPR